MKYSRLLWRHPTAAFLAGLYLCATLQFVRYYSKSTTFYLNMDAYLSGQERLPFQERVLPIFFIRPLTQSQWVARHFVHSNGMYTADRGPLYVLSLVSVLIAGFFVQQLYDRVSQGHLLRFLVYPLFLFAIMWSYSIHNEADFSYPYDMLSVAFFAAGLYFIYIRKFWPLVPIMFFGTLNRETTLFLIGIYVLDAASSPSAGPGTALRERFSPGMVPWLRVALLSCIWLAVKVSLARHFAHNDSSENYVPYPGELRPAKAAAVAGAAEYLRLHAAHRLSAAPLSQTHALCQLPVYLPALVCRDVLHRGHRGDARVWRALFLLAAVALTVVIERYLQERAEQTSIPALATDSPEAWASPERIREKAAA